MNFLFYSGTDTQKGFVPGCIAIVQASSPDAFPDSCFRVFLPLLLNQPYTSRNFFVYCPLKIYNRFHMIFKSAEMRWFLPGDVPMAVEDWFNGISPRVLEQEVRTDHYLNIPGSELMSIKIREGNLEFKQRSRGNVLSWKKADVSGHIDFWQKWSFPVRDHDVMVSGIENYRECWTEVVKQRSLILFQASAEGQIARAHEGFLPANGCGLELTRIEMPGRHEKWWTLGFEAFGKEEGLSDMLVVVAELVFSLPAPPSLALHDSFAYPSLLANPVSKGSDQGSG
jgi:hypothetical protein